MIFRKSPRGGATDFQARHHESLTRAALLQAGLVSSPQLGHMRHSPVRQVLIYDDLPALRLLAKEA